jgi:hypothetical protein
MVIEAIMAFFVTFFSSFLGIPHLRMYINPFRVAYKLEDYYDEIFSIGVIFTVLGLLLLIASFLAEYTLVMVFGAALLGLGLGISLHPLYLLHLSRRKVEEVRVSGLHKKVVDLAAKYGGILSPLHLIKEFDIGIEVAIKVLEKFVYHGLAVRINKPLLGTFYDFAIVRAHMAETERKIIEILRDNPEGLTIPRMVDTTGLSIESLKHTLERLIAEGVVVSRHLEGKYVLRGYALS